MGIRKNLSDSSKVFLNLTSFAHGSYPDSSPLGCEQMIGDVWEWTSSEFTGYPGFKSGFDEYNDKWSQKVLRGGSFATPSMSIKQFQHIQIFDICFVVGRDIMPRFDLSCGIPNCW